MSSRPFLARGPLIAAGLVLALAACGRRGALEPPPDPAAAQAEKTEASRPEAPGTLPSPVGTARQSSKARGYVIPKEPFILDPLL